MLKVTTVILLVISLAAPVRAQSQASAEWSKLLVDAAIERTLHSVRYDGSYRAIDYPMGDVPDSIGVCTDLIIRAYRALGIDLQRKVHEDMLGAFSEYPQLWGQTSPDHNIDHRRVLNLRVFFRRNGEELEITRSPGDYREGDIVTWLLPGSMHHIGIVLERRSADQGRPLVVHNIGRGPEIEDILFEYSITGHYRYGVDARGHP